MPVPGKQLGGPDFLLTPQRTGVLVGDVAITTGIPTMSSVFSRKLTQYETFSPTVHGTTFPFVLNTRGALHSKTLKILRDNSFPEPYIRDVSVNCQCALIKAIASSFFRLAVRPSDTAVPIDDDDDDDEFALSDSAADDD